MTTTNLTPGKNYQVINTKFLDGGGLFSSNSVYEFSRSFYGFDARHHGAANPDDYYVFVFKLPAKFGEISFYKFQIKDIIEF